MGKEVVFIWVPGDVDIRGNSAADSAAKDSLVGNISGDLIPIIRLKMSCKQICVRTMAVSVGRIP